MSADPYGVRTASGRPLADLTLDAVRAGKLSVADFRISRETLQRQAAAAAAAGYAHVAENLLRAAELTGVSNADLLEMYEALRPSRTTVARLDELARHLEDDLGAPLTAALVREAAEVYRQRGLVR
jgi:propanediol dehydratase small subunit